MVLKRILKTIQVGKNSSQVPRYFKMEERLKKVKNFKLRTGVVFPCGHAHETALASTACALAHHSMSPCA